MSYINEKFSEAVKNHTAGRLSEAESIYRYLVEINPKFYPALVNLAEIRIAQNDLVEGISFYRKAVKILLSHTDMAKRAGVASQQYSSSQLPMTEENASPTPPSLDKVPDFIYSEKPSRVSSVEEWEKIKFAPPVAVGVELLSNCNRKCSYCPQSKFDRNGGRLTDEIFISFVDQLRDWGFSGVFEPGWLNEPLVDKRFMCLMQYARAQLPNARFHLPTNGDLLSADYAKEMLDTCFDTIRITQHDKEFSREEELASFLRRYPEYSSRLTILRPGWEPLAWGDVVDGHPRGMYMDGCVWARKLIVNAWGDTGRCCVDVHAKEGAGNISELPLKEIWRRSEPMRRALFLGQHIQQDNGCRACVGLPPLEKTST
ncbi:MAG TPA: SPASM domain-containing protein [Azospirillum sp.]|nr:SPASM domain-containing protein [Azospirillum sp.]